MEENVRDVIIGKQALEHMISNYPVLNTIEKRTCKLMGIANRQLPCPYPIAIEPARFAEAVLPFLHVAYNRKVSVIDDVDPWKIIGGKYKTYTDNTEAETEIINRLNSMEDIQNIAAYCKIRQIPLYVAIEGKNRVELYRKHGINIRARVSEIDYIPSSELAMFRTSPWGIYYVRCRRFDGVVEESVVPFPQMTIPLLQKYGVCVTDNETRVNALWEWRKMRRKISIDQMAP